MPLKQNIAVTYLKEGIPHPLLNDSLTLSDLVTDLLNLNQRLDQTLLKLKYDIHTKLPLESY